MNGANKAKPGRTPPAGRDTYHHGDLRRALLDAARAEIAANGAQSLTLSSLARRAGVAQSAPYRHFADREALLSAIAMEGFLALSAALRNAAESGDDGGRLERLTAAYLQFGEGNVECYRLMFASRLVPDSAPGSPLTLAAEDSYQLLLTNVAAHAHRGPFESARMVWARLHGLVMLKADGFIEQPLLSFLPELVR